MCRVDLYYNEVCSVVRDFFVMLCRLLTSEVEAMAGVVC